MYFPYLRGRQYDLLALKELSQKNLISREILPVIEPVKMSSTLKGTLQAYADKALRLAIVLNPTVGDLAEEEVVSLHEQLNDKIIPAVIMNEDTEHVVDSILQQGFTKNNILVILNERDYVDDYKRIFGTVEPLYTLLPDERALKRTVTKKKVLFEDKFNKLSKNADYAKNEDEFFSEDHLFYSDEGYDGFGDYSIIGKIYDESGFAPRAVAIHIVYFNLENHLRVHHFVSDSNYGIEDIAGKYYEAVSKLQKWYANGHEGQRTSALSVLLEHAHTGYFPGLPTIKKLSIMHHIELVNKFLSKKE